MTTEAEAARAAAPRPTSPTSRRAMLVAAAGGIGAFLASGLGRGVPASRAAAGGNLILGASNSAGSSQTVLTSSAGGAAFTLKDTAAAGTGIFGWSSAATGAGRALYGRADSPDGFGLQARTNGGHGAGAAIQAIGGNNDGLHATTDYLGSATIRADHNNSGYAVYATSAGTVVRATSTDGVAVWGSSDNNNGLHGDANGGNGVSGQSISAAGVYGYSTGGYGVWGHSVGAVGVFGDASTNTGVYGLSGSGYGVRGHSSSNAGVYGSSTSSYSGYFSGDLWAQSANAAVKAFRIDHPLDPANKVLVHSCVESNERKLVYDGTATTGPSGEATIELPAYFEALNRDVRYQLTVVGSFAQAIVKREVAGNRFLIATSEPRTKVCWQVSGVRKDAFATAHPLEVESVKAGHERGRYLTPREHGQPDSAGVDAALGA